MNLEDILMAIQANVDRSNDDLDWDDEDVMVRIAIANRGLRQWARDNTTEWQELLEPVVIGTIASGSTSFSLEENYHLLKGVYLDDTGEPVEVRRVNEATRSGRYVYVSGNKKDGYQLNLGWVVEEGDRWIGKKLRVIYYKDVEKLKKAKDVPEMSDPDYLVAYVTSELMIDDDTTQYSKYTNDATTALANMRQRNDRLADTEESNVMDDDINYPIGGFDY